jgi:CHAT domain-containing protein
MNVPSSLLRDRVLNPTMDARAHNLHQARLIANPTPEIDSIVEHLAAIAETATDTQRGHVLELLRLVRDLAASNHAEGTRQQTVAGVVDRLAADLRRHETTARTSFGVQQLARALRKPLETIVNARGAGSAKYVTAVRQIEDVLRMVPATHLLDNVSLRHELGVAKYDALTRIIDGRTS